MTSFFGVKVNSRHRVNFNVNVLLFNYDRSHDEAKSVRSTNIVQRKRQPVGRVAIDVAAELQGDCGSLRQLLSSLRNVRANAFGDAGAAASDPHCDLCDCLRMGKRPTWTTHWLESRRTSRCDLCVLPRARRIFLDRLSARRYGRSHHKPVTATSNRLNQFSYATYVQNFTCSAFRSRLLRYLHASGNSGWQTERLVRQKDWQRSPSPLNDTLSERLNFIRLSPNSFVVCSSTLIVARGRFTQAIASYFLTYDFLTCPRQCPYAR